MNFNDIHLPELFNYLAPDGSEIRLLSSLPRGGMCHVTLPPDTTSKAVKHLTVEEIWYFIEGRGQVWRWQAEQGQVVEVKPGMSLAIPTGTHFQFRNTGTEPLRFLFVTMPQWPGDEEAVPVTPKWDD